jgi:integrase/recombinase XerC
VLEPASPTLAPRVHPPARPEPTPPDGPGGGQLLGIVAAIAAQTRPSPKTRADYTAIYDRFTTWLAAGLGRAPLVGDLDLERLLAWRNHRETSGGHRGTGVAPATLRVELAALRALARQAGRGDLADALHAPGGKPAPPETITRAQYERLLAMPDHTTRIGRRDHAILRVLGDTGSRSAELRRLRAADLVRGRVDSPRRSLRIRAGKGGRGRTVPLTVAADTALERWLAVHPAGRPLPEPTPLFVTLGRGGRDVGRALSDGALGDLVRVHARTAGIPERLAHPHALRHYWATRHAELGTAIHRLQQLGGWEDLRTVQVYLGQADPELAGDIDRLDADDAARRQERR